MPPAAVASGSEAAPAFDQWADVNGQTDFVTCLQAAAASLRNAVTADSADRTPP